MMGVGARRLHRVLFAICIAFALIGLAGVELDSFRGHEPVFDDCSLVVVSRDLD